MEKRKLHIKLNNESFNTLGEVDNNIIMYYESNKLRSKMIIDLEKETLVKENIDYKISLDFKKNNEIYLKKEDGKINLDIKLIKFKKDDKKLIINYQIVDSKEEVLLEIEGDLR